MTRSEVRDCAFKLIFENLLREDPLEELYATADEIKQTNIDSNPEQLGKYIISNRNIVLNSAETEEDKQKAIALLEKISELLRIEKPEYISECIWSNMDLLDEVIGIYIVREKGEIYIDSKVKKLTENVLAHAEETDSIISKFSPKREFKRIARINVAILRIAIYEINYESKNISMNSAISEAVKISQMYSQPEDTAFVNGVLGAYARSLKANENNA
jgi:N utilization substance protein B